MTTWFRTVDRRFAFFWESPDQPAGRWHGPGEGPAHYVADTPDGAWAEFLRHEEITDPADLDGISRSLWVLDVPADASDQVAGPGTAPATGGLASYPECQAHARAARAAGATALIAPSAALRSGRACGQRTAAGLVEGPPRDGRVLVLFGNRPDLVGWRAVDSGRPAARLLTLLKPLV